MSEGFSVLSKALTMTVPKTPDKNRQLLRILTNSVRVLTARQAQEVLGEPSHERVKSRFRRLQSKGLLRLTTSWICPPALDPSPLAAWEPELPPPDFFALARTANHRWSAEQSPHMLATATDQARNLFGAVHSRQPRESEVAHDVWVAELYIRRAFRNELQSWVHEDGFDDLFPEGNRPDAALVTTEGNAKAIAMELLGKYRQEKIEQLHNYCQAFGICYELW